MHISSWVEAYAPLVARILMGGMFLMGGLYKWLHLAGTADMIATTPLPAPMLFAIAAAVIETLFGAMILVGYKTRLAAAVLIIFTIAATYFFHLGWNEDATEQVMFTKNLAIIAGLLYMTVYGAGRFALGKRI